MSSPDTPGEPNNEPVSEAPSGGSDDPLGTSAGALPQGSDGPTAGRSGGGRSRSNLKRIIAGFVVAIIAFFGVNWIRGATDDVAKLTAGDCVVQEGSDGVKPASCSDSGAFRVTRKIEGTTVAVACGGLAYTQQRGSKKFVLCLEPAK